VRAATAPRSPARLSALVGARPGAIPSVLLSAFLLCGLAACGAGGDSAGGPGTASSTSSTSASTTATTTTSSTGTGTTSTTTSSGTSSSSGPGGRMTQGLSAPVLLERSGGIAGRRDLLQVRPDGTYTVSTRGSRPVTRQLSEGELAAVVSAVRAADLRSVGTGPRPMGAQADMFRYKIVAEGAMVMTTDQQADSGVRRLIDVLIPLLSSPAPRP
jgi:hypothetical protein